MELLRSWNFPISMTPVVPYNYMEFHGHWSGPSSLGRAVQWNPVETPLASKMGNLNLKFSNFDDTSSSMEFLENLKLINSAGANSSVEFHETSHVIENGKFEVSHFR